MRPIRPLLMRGTAAVATTYTTLDSRDKTANFALTNGDLTATRSGGSGVGWAMGRDGKATGKWKFEVTINAIGTGCVVGIVGAGSAPNPYLGGTAITANSVGVASPGATGILREGITRATHAGYTTGSVITVMVDPANSNVWFAINGTVINGDPEAGTGTANVVGFNGTKAWYPAFQADSGSVQATFNFGASPWAYPSLAPSFAGWTQTVAPASFATFRAMRMGVLSLGWFAHIFAEWELMTSSGGANILTGGTVSASHSQVSGFTLAGAQDGNTATSTAIAPSGSGTQNQAVGWWQYDFGSNASRNATHFAIRARAGASGEELQAPTFFNLLLSDDGTIFHKVKVGATFSAFVGATPGQRKEVAL